MMTDYATPLVDSFFFIQMTMTGTAPLVATALIQRTGSHLAPSGMVVFAAVMTGVGALMARAIFGTR